MEEYTYLNTSHVLIYPYTRTESSNSDRFKYISCSYLSGLKKLLTTSSENLNTSHVLIYLSVKFREGIKQKFKYISCSYLSKLHA